MAIMAAFERVRGEVVATRCGPAEIPKLLEAVETRHDVVGSFRRERQDAHPGWCEHPQLQERWLSSKSLEGWYRRYMEPVLTADERSSVRPAR